MRTKEIKYFICFLVMIFLFLTTISFVTGAFVPADPTTLTNSTGRFWINYTWIPGTGNTTDCYNISYNGTWDNTTCNTYRNESVGAHGYLDIKVYAYNNTGDTLSSENLTDNVTLPNNAVTISNVTAAYSINESKLLFIDATGTDADSDILTFSCNRTDLFTDFSMVTGAGNWTPGASDSGTYSVDFGVSDGYGSTSNQTTVITVADTKYIKIELVSFTPLTPLSVGTFNVTWLAEYGMSDLNNTSVSMVWKTQHIDGFRNWSMMMPYSDKAPDGWRPDNRNGDLNFETNDSITNGTIWEWAGVDENSTRLTISPVNSTHSYIYYNGTAQDSLNFKSWYLDRTDMEEAPKTVFEIYKNHYPVMKIYDPELYHGRDHIVGLFLDAAPFGALDPTVILRMWIGNSSFDPADNVDIEDSSNGAYVTAWNATSWQNHVYSPRPNSSYVRTYFNTSEVGINMTTGSYFYVVLISDTQPSKAFNLNVTNVASSTNKSFADTGVMWEGTTPYSFTPNMFLEVHEDDMYYHTKLYAANTDGLWNSSTPAATLIDVSKFPPTAPVVNYFYFNGVADYNMNSTYSGTFDINILPGHDPDGGVTNHNLTVHYKNLTYAGTINNTFSNGVSSVNVSFNSTEYSTLYEYTLRIIATDDESVSVTTWLGVNFSINYDNFSFTNSGITPATIRENDPFTVSVDVTDYDGNIDDVIVKINYNNYTMVNTINDTWTYTFTGTNVATRYYIENFYAQDDYGAWNSTTSALYIDAVSSTISGSSGRSSISPWISNEPLENILCFENGLIRNIKCDHRISYIVRDDECLKITSISFVPTSISREQPIYIEKLKSRSIFITETVPNYEIFNFNLYVGLLGYDSKTEQEKIFFKLRKTGIENAGLDEISIKLYKWSTEKKTWIRKYTELIDSDDDFYYYESDSGATSGNFAISGKKSIPKEKLSLLNEIASKIPGLGNMDLIIPDVIGKPVVNPFLHSIELFINNIIAEYLPSLVPKEDTKVIAFTITGSQGTVREGNDNLNLIMVSVFSLLIIGFLSFYYNSETWNVSMMVAIILIGVIYILFGNNMISILDSALINLLINIILISLISYSAPAIFEEFRRGIQ